MLISAAKFMRKFAGEDSKCYVSRRRYHRKFFMRQFLAKENSGIDIEVFVYICEPTRCRNPRTSNVAELNDIIGRKTRNVSLHN